MALSTVQTTGDPVLYGKVAEDRIALVTLNRPHALNAYDISMRDSLFAILQAVRDDPDVRVVVLQGNGRAFSTGGDLREFGSAPSPVLARATRWRRDVWGTLWNLPQITIAAVHGLVVGGGFEMAMLCDQCVASSDATFSLPETGLGMIPGVGGTQTLPPLIGRGRALDLVLTGRALSAAEAKRWGLVQQVTRSASLRSAALARARKIAAIDPRLTAMLKRSINHAA